MNDRIRELAEQARLGRGPEKIHISENGVVIFYLDELEKFAELIVRECADIATINAHQYQPPGDFVLKHFGFK